MFMQVHARRPRVANTSRIVKGSKDVVMSVLLETTEGDIVIDLHVDYVPKVCENFLKLCKVKYYNFSPLFNINPTAFFQSGDPIGPPDGDGGTSIYGLLQGPSRRYFKADRNPKLKHVERGTVSMTISKDKTTEHELAGSQFIVTLADNLDYLDASAVPFGRVAEGFDTLEKIVGLYLDHDGRPYKDTRILHTIILDDPFPDPEGLTEPTASPPPSKAQLATVRISEDELNNTTDEALTESELSARKREREAKAQALTLEMLGDLPSADLAPPENVLFVCKLNPLTSSPDLSLIFSRFGQIISCRIITDPHTGASLGYGFIEFEKREECERAYFKMQGVLIDDRRIHVDFGQSLNGGRGVDWGAWIMVAGGVGGEGGEGLGVDLEGDMVGIDGVLMIGEDMITEGMRMRGGGLRLIRALDERSGMTEKSDEKARVGIDAIVVGAEKEVLIGETETGRVAGSAVGVGTGEVEMIRGTETEVAITGMMTRTVGGKGVANDGGSQVGIDLVIEAVTGDGDPT
ncbi:hypothetical protein G7K_4639-t1 [Saitoella complicata NRRL Y-17804]|uniref:Peptidyl-prolyl cis-trans isomerase n=1 Tax=Saitoella complicata (strain BCRC 22490 / CBS 7301 / JCM 7358 / NBRC 10748 / NRRL Y-17804) TaxID=698492 RepID=A0A0E9NM71_SAICN|nr:hypothetical protein G7K_4639-t1 [Saitoella complicata NRRL Y-17804]